MAVYKSKKITKDGRQYFFRIKYKDIFGVTHDYSSTKYKTLKEAKDEEAIYRIKIVNQVINTSNITLDQAYQELLINKTKKNRVIINDELKERGYGELEGEYVKNGNYNIKQMWDIDNIYNLYGVEPIDVFIKRIHRFLDNIINDNKYKKVLLVSHSGVSIATKVYFEGIPEDKDLLKLEIGNCEVIKFESKN